MRGAGLVLRRFGGCVLKNYRGLTLSTMLVARQVHLTNYYIMFLVTAFAATSICHAYHAAGEAGALAELHNQFPGIVDDEAARLCARTIGRWEPFEQGRVARRCRVSLAARRSESF